MVRVPGDFGGVRMGHHRSDPAHRSDHILAQSDRGLKYLREHSPDVAGDRFKTNQSYATFSNPVRLARTNVKNCGRKRSESYSTVSSE